MVFGFTTTYAISAYRHWSCECEYIQFYIRYFFWLNYKFRIAMLSVNNTCFIDVSLKWGLPAHYYICLLSELMLTFVTNEQSTNKITNILWINSFIKETLKLGVIRSHRSMQCPIEKEQGNLKIHSEVINGRTDNTMVNRTRKIRQTMIYQSLFRKINIELHEPH